MSEAIAMRSVYSSRIGGRYTVERCGVTNDRLESLLEGAGVVLAHDLGFASCATTVCIYKHPELQFRLWSSLQFLKLELITSSIP